MTKRTGRRTTEAPSADLIEAVLLGGDLSQLTPDQRLSYYKSVCESLSLNPLTKPFDYITLDGKLVLYARKDCTEQLRKINNISLHITSREIGDGVYTVVAQAKLGKRVDEAIGVVPLEIVKEGKTHQLTAAARANNMMKAETKAKRRVTLSICGLGLLDESEIESAQHLELTQSETTTQPTSNGVTERNVKEATANATGEPAAKPPEAITLDNYKDVVCHVGKAEGNILGRKVGDIHPKIIQWLVDNWIPKLPPVPGDKDARLRDAILLAKDHPRENGETSVGNWSGPEGSDKKAGAHTEFTPQDVGARTAAITDLRGRIEDLVLTEPQFMEYLKEQGVSEQNWQTLDDLPDSMLLVLCTPKHWKMASDGIKEKLKPKVDETAKPKRKRKEAKGPFDV